MCVVQQWWACGDGGFSQFVVVEQNRKIKLWCWGIYYFNE